MSISLKEQENVRAQNEVMINHGTLFNDHLNTKFILTVFTLLLLHVPILTTKHLKDKLIDDSLNG